jgi:hypothetical protein
MRPLRPRIPNITTTYPEPTKKGFPNLLFGPVHPGVWTVCHLTAALQLSHNHHTQMSERVSVSYYGATELYRPIRPSSAIANDPSATSSSSPYPSRPDPATYTRPELVHSAYPQRPPQTPAVYGMRSAHLSPRPYPLTFIVFH